MNLARREVKLAGIWQFIKFALVGIANTLVDWAVFYLLILFIIPDDKLLAKAISFVVAAINSFVLNSIWTFRQEFYSGIKDKNLRFYRIANYFIRFFVVSLVGFAINYFAFRWVIFNIAGTSFANYANIISLISASSAALVWNFVINKFWTYKTAGEEKLSPGEQKKKVQMFKFNLAAAGLIAIMVTISFFVMKGDAAIVDETAHIPAGYSYVKFHDYRLNPEHPPLAKYIAGVPLAFMNLSDLRTDSSWKVINQWDSGWYFLYRAGNDANAMIFWSRLPMLLFLILIGVVLYKWAVELFGSKTGLFVLFLYTFTPDFIAHGHFVTTDVPAAFGFLLAAYTFYKFLEKRNWKTFIFAATALGIAQLLKFSAFLLYPMFLILIFVRAYYDLKIDGEKFWLALWQRFKDFFWVSLASLGLVWLVYIPMVWNTPVSVEKRLILNNLTPDPRTLILRNFLDHFVNNPISRALGHYLLGLMLVFSRVAGGNSTFIISHSADKAIPWFFPVAWLIKTPAMVIILTFFATIYSFFRQKTRQEKWLLWFVLIPFALYWLISIRGSLNIGTRHLLPTVAFLYLFIGFIMRDIIESKKIAANIAVIACIFFLAIPVLSAYPNYLGYMNIFTYGHPGYNMMVDSSLDWGQDLKRLKNYLAENNISEANLKIDYFGGGLVSYYMPQAKVWRSGFGPTSGNLAISATFYQMSKLQGKEAGKWSYDWLDRYQPTAIIGSGILLFQITPEDLKKNPPTSPYPITHYDTPTKSDVPINQL